MKLETLEQKIEIRAKNKMLKAIDIWRKEIEAATKKLFLTEGHKIHFNLSKPIGESERESWGTKDNYDRTKDAAHLLSVCQLKTLTYPYSLLAIYKQHEELQILAICQEVAQLNSDPIDDPDILPYD